MTFKKDSAIIFNLQMQSLSTEILNKCLKVAEPVAMGSPMHVNMRSYSAHGISPSLPFWGALEAGQEEICLRLPEVWGTDPAQTLPQCHTAYVPSASWSGAPQTPRPSVCKAARFQDQIFPHWPFPSPLPPLQSPTSPCLRQRDSVQTGLPGKVILQQHTQPEKAAPKSQQFNQSNLKITGCSLLRTQKGCS